MNKTRANKISSLRSSIEDIKDKLEIERDEETEALENLSETAREGDKGQAMEQAVEYMVEAISNLESALENMENAENSTV